MKLDSKPWVRPNPPKRILAIRMQAMGDTVITLPYLQALKHILPNTRIDFLTRLEVASIPQNVDFFSKVYVVKGQRNFSRQLIYSIYLLPRLIFNRYDIVIDLQNNRISRIVRRVIRPESWSGFDRFSPIPAGDRTRQTIDKLGLGKCYIDSSFILKSNLQEDTLLKENGWDGESDLIVFNPAGAFENRNWPLEKYIEFGYLWLEKYPKTQILILGIEKISNKAIELKKAFANRVVDLVGKTNSYEAFCLLRRVKFVLSEDSGLMHMSWIQGIPTLALFGSTRSDWARPLGEYSDYVDSSDMACGNCMLEDCILSGIHKNECLKRFSAAYIFQKALLLYTKF